jgi:hypothetical protein
VTAPAAAEHQDDGGSESAVEYIDNETDSHDGVESGYSIDA